MPKQFDSIDQAFDRWLPEKPHTAEATTASAEVVQEPPAERVSAALSLDHPDVCPYCKRTMNAVIASGIPSFMCDYDRHVAPAPNDSGFGALEAS